MTEFLKIDPLTEIIKALKIVHPGDKYLWDRIEYAIRDQLAKVAAEATEKAETTAASEAKMVPWIAVDFDGTLSHYDGYVGHTELGPPIALMVEQVRKWRREGKRVKVFTARVAPKSGSIQHLVEVRESLAAIQAWCQEHVGEVLEVTNIKDHGMIALYDDRAFRVEKNTGKIMASQF